MTVRTLFALLLAAGGVAAQEPTPAPAGTDPTTTPGQPASAAPAQTLPTPATAAPMTMTPQAVTPMAYPAPGTVVQGGYVTPMTGYPYQPGMIVQSGYAQQGVVSGTPVVSGLTSYPTYQYPIYPTYGTNYPAYGGAGYATPGMSAGNGFVGTVVGYPTRAARRLFRR